MNANNQTPERNVCKRCLLRDIDRDEYFSNIYEYIQSLPPESKADDAEYERRLAVCQSCDRLVNGMCAVCGCFVEARAAKAAQRCAKTNENW